MTPYISGSSPFAQARYATDTRQILESWPDGTAVREEWTST